ncbi:MAG: ABC transporter permease [Clostridium sp.]|uniref:ABC transporter permease n=1 Tax=Clostridium chrysemydis TaxID=2665504 RepID=UPI003EE6103C
MGYLKRGRFIIFTLVFFILILVTVVMNISLIEEELKERGNFETENAVDLSFNKFSEDQIIEFINEVKKDKDLIIKYYCSVVSEIKVSGPNILGVHFNDKFTKDFSLKEGRFFNKEDFDTYRKVVVVGKDILPFTKESNGYRYVTIGEDDYEVIGVIDGKDKISTSEYILYNLNPVIKEEHNIIDNSWVIDSNVINRDEITKRLINIESKSNEGKINIHERGKALEKGDSVYLIAETLGALGLAAIAVLLSLIRAIDLWIQKLSIEIGVRFCSGGSKGDIIMLLLKKYMVMSFISSIIAGGVLSILSNLNITNLILFEFNIKVIVVSMILGILMGVIIIPLLVLKFKSMNASKLMKGGV